MVAAWLVEWSDPVHVVVNVLASIVWIAALIDLIRLPRGNWYTRRGAVLMGLAVACVNAFIAGFLIPIGAIGWFGWWRKHGGLGRLPQMGQ